MASYAILKLAGEGRRPNAYARRMFDDDVEAALQKLHANAVALYSQAFGDEAGEAHAACVLAHILAKAAPSAKAKGGRCNGVSGSYKPRPWAIAILAKHQDAIAEAFAREAQTDVVGLNKDSGIGSSRRRGVSWT